MKFSFHINQWQGRTYSAQGVKSDHNIANRHVQCETIAQEESNALYIRTRDSSRYAQGHRSGAELKAPSHTHDPWPLVVMEDGNENGVENDRVDVSNRRIIPARAGSSTS